MEPYRIIEIKQGIFEDNNRQAEAPDLEQLKTMLTPALQKRFKPAFLGRLQVVPYYPIHDEIMRLTIRLKLDRIQARMLLNRKIAFSYDDALVESVAARTVPIPAASRPFSVIAGMLVARHCPPVCEKPTAVRSRSYLPDCRALTRSPRQMIPG